MSRLSRRAWLGLAGTAGLGWALGACGWAQRRPPPTYRVVDAGLNHTLAHRLRGPLEALPPSRTTHTGVVIVGGGVAGLSAAWALRRAGVEDFVLLELEDQAGGNAAAGANAVSEYPWGAHYLPLVNDETELTRALLDEFGLITGTDARGRPIYDELALVHDPVERLYYRGRWHEALEPGEIFGREGRQQLDRLERELAQYETRRDARGRRWFSIPTALGSDAPELRALDAIPFTQWLDARGYTHPSLRWYLDYCVRDDYGLSLSQTSAWGGLHYFAGRVGQAANADDEAVLTWPEGNAYLVRRLAQPLGPRLRTGLLAYRLEAEADGVTVHALSAQGAPERLHARAAVVATPLHVAARLCPQLGLPSPAQVGLRHQPWVVCNVTVQAVPESHGAPLAWDNVSYHSSSLGYIHATHQQVGRRDPRTVLTWYQALCDDAPGGDERARRAQALATPPQAWAAQAVADFERMHPGITAAISEVAVRVWGHGMAGPALGARFHPRLVALRQQALAQGRIALAHTDLSALSIFEEAQQLGVAAAAAVLRRLGHPPARF